MGNNDIHVFDDSAEEWDAANATTEKETKSNAKEILMVGIIYEYENGTTNCYCDSTDCGGVFAGGTFTQYSFILQSV